MFGWFKPSPDAYTLAFDWEDGVSGISIPFYGKSPIDVLNKCISHKQISPIANVFRGAQEKPGKQVVIGGWITHKATGKKYWFVCIATYKADENGNFAQFNFDYGIEDRTDDISTFP